MTTKPDVGGMNMETLIEKYGTEGISLVLRSFSDSDEHVSAANDLAEALRSYLANPDRDLHR